MPAKWQQWMPFYIDAFKSSPSVRAMHPTARCGYLYLLAFAWQTDDCTLPNDTLDLAEISEIGDVDWGIYGPRIMRKFETVTVENSDGHRAEKLRNPNLYKKWLKAKEVHDARKKAADRTNGSRSPQVPATVTDASPSRSAHTHTRTYTGTDTEVLKNLPDEAPPASVVKVKKPPTKSDLVKSRHEEFKTAILGYWESRNPGVPCPWDGAEGKQLGMWLTASPAVTVEQFTAWLRNRYRSEVNHAERPSRWISNVTSFANGPVDKFNKPIVGEKKSSLDGMRFANGRPN